MYNVQAKIFFTLPAILAISACTGGSDGAGIGNLIEGGSANAQFTTLAAFSDGAGVAQGQAANGERAILIAPEIAQVVASANDPVTGIQFSSFPIVQTLPTAKVRSGTVTLDGNVANITIVEDNGGEAGLIYVEFPGYANALAAVGNGVGVLPNGQFTYNGVHVVGSRFSNEYEVGAFTLDADFTNRTFSYNGTTTSTSLTGSGIIDASNGTLRSNNMTSNVPGSTSGANLYGQMHGGAAQSVSGVFHTNESNPSYAGGFAGSVSP